MHPADVGKQPPFVPEVLKTVVGPPPPQGIYEEAGLYLKLYDYAYAGQNQTARINFKWFPPV